MEALLDPFQSGIGRRALLELLLLGLACGPLGFWIVSFRLAYPSESLSHGLLPGLVLAALIGAPLLGGAAVGAVVAALLVGAAARDERVGPDAATAVVATGLIGLGGLLAFVPDEPQRLGDLLFGDPLAASGGELAVTGLFAVVALALLAALHRPLAVLALDAADAGPLVARPGLVRVALLVLVAGGVVVAVRGLGNLLALAVLVAPALAVRRHVHGRVGAMAAAAAVACGGAVVGLELSYHAEVAAGAAVALALCVAAAVGLAAGAARPADTSS
jgi:ABC-type Mn2+/Zn2+ transport system permease subunit